MKIFHPPNPKLEKEIERKTSAFIELIHKDKKLKKYIKAFGLTGTAARGQASPRASDIDFYCITNYINPLHEAYLFKKFNKAFKNLEIDADVLTFSPTVYKKPGLMFYELVNFANLKITVL